ncbi:unnamed protein product [Kuraishia capsulata CBS 1993]|uniref:PhoD-like phosphatase metallophosphatase domain-containing protein n=1 Tax=Kuraishia capsulata CBS 1993 TaxID=1382522 RepID=W6MF10_9ASCO|nr:uncharacterized protein KUCA_T00000034001 [Kuraishia capsulata CBS 1993]CDK24074.1 unnamed protein product [Kuraishia capsulata CBS 1993]
MRYQLYCVLLILLKNAACLPQFISNGNLERFGGISVDEYRYSNVLTESSFEHGIASGDPTMNSIILWTRITIRKNTHGLVPVYLAISESLYMENATRYTTFTNSEIDYTVKVDVEGLDPGKTYYYQFLSADGESTRIGRTKTLPPNSWIGELKFAVYSCSNFAGGFFTSYAMPAVKDSVDYVIHLGDYIYEHENGVYTNGTAIGRTHLPNTEMWTLKNYRDRYAVYRSDHDLQLSHAQFPWILVWDDHEVADNSWLRGSVNSIGWDFLERKENAIRAYIEWLPIRPQQNINKIWRRLKFGKLLDLLMIDTRHYSRDVTDVYTNTDYIASIADREERTMMGFDQEDWLYSSLKTSESVWKVIGSQTVVNHVEFGAIGDIIGAPFSERNYDSFDGYTANRRRLLDAIDENNISNVVLVSGDFHVSWVHELKKDVESYDMKTGEGSLLVEFASTACSSPTTFPKHFTIEDCLKLSETFVSSNVGVLWNEGWYRGYFELTLNEKEVQADYFGTNVTNDIREEVKLATFVVDQGKNRIRRSFDGQIHYGFLDPRVM